MIFLGISLVMNGSLTLGSYMAFMTLAGYFMEPIGNLVGLQLSIQEANISMKRLSEIMEYEQEQALNIKNNRNVDEFWYQSPYKKINNIKGDICFSHVTFRYGNRKPVLKDISFCIPKGKKVAIVGASGSGKSTIAKLILKYYELEEGNITIDGEDINEYQNISLRRAISYVPQTIELFSKSIFDNIRIARPGATLAEVIEAAKKADAHEFIKKLPMQYYTFLEEAGNGLSGGEKQRIALARAFLKDSQFYILDESTSNLDFVTENIIFDMIYKTFAEKSMLIIAHRISTIKNCDQILVIDQGKIIEQGTHKELLGLKGQYSRIWEMQQGNFEISQEITQVDRKEMLSEKWNDDVISYTS